jgi:hypothetical protein
MDHAAVASYLGLIVVGGGIIYQLGMLTQQLKTAVKTMGELVHIVNEHTKQIARLEGERRASRPIIEGDGQ